MGSFITFRVARQELAIDAARVQALLPVHEMTLLDSPHGFICGTASLDGLDFPVIDLHRCLAIAGGPPGRRPYVIAAKVHGSRLVGFIADRLTNVVSLRECDVLGDSVRVGGRTRRLLDPDSLLSEPQLQDLSAPIIP